MDRVRLGRVLGRGARLAAKTAYEAIDAAAAPNPASASLGKAKISPTKSVAEVRNPASRTVLQPLQRQPSTSTATAATALPRTSSRASGPGAAASMFLPIKRASRAVSLEVTGSFFALFAFSFFVGLWHKRAMVHAGSGGAFRFGAGCLVGLVFTYFAVSNFRRAGRVQ